MLRKISLLLLLVIAVLACGLADRLRAPGELITTTHAGLERQYRLYVPASYEATQSTPLVFVLHGGGGNSRSTDRVTGGIHEWAETERFIVVYPDGIENHWNDSRPVEDSRAHQENLDDVGFLVAIIAEVQAGYNIDPKRVYATGISNGGMMSLRLACDASAHFAGVAAVTAAMPESLLDQCQPADPVAVLILNGTADPLVPWDGSAIGAGRRGRVISAPDTFALWADLNQCSGDSTSGTLPDTDPDDGTRITWERYEQCAANTAVALYTVEGGGHTWPGGSQYFPEALIGKVSQDAAGNDIIWQFFESHPKP